jgi:hypothetical protein
MSEIVVLAVTNCGLAKSSGGVANGLFSITVKFA